MTKLEMVEKMRITIVEMSEILDRIEIKLDVPIRSEELKSTFITKGYKWIYGDVVTAFKSVMEVWKLLPKEIWDRYKLWGFTNDRRESIMLEEQLAIFKKIVNSKTRPDFFKRSKCDAAIKALDKKASRGKGKPAGKRIPKAE